MAESLGFTLSQNVGSGFLRHLSRYVFTLMRQVAAPHGPRACARRPRVKRAWPWPHRLLLADCPHRGRHRVNRHL